MSKNKVTVFSESNIDLCKQLNLSHVSIEVPLNIVTVIELLLNEYKHACEKHPSFPQNKFEQLAILQEEVGEYSKELQNDALNLEVGTNTVTELAQIGAVVLRMLENYK